MRIKIELEANEEFPKWAFGKHAIQAMIYSHVNGTEYGELHDRKGFKFFCFSDMYPIGHFKPGVRKTLLISSPDRGFIEALYEKLLPDEKLYLGRHSLNVVSIKKFKLKPRRAFITGSPVVLNGKPTGKFFTFYHGGTMKRFIEAITANALDKYRTFTGEYFELDGPLFTRMVPRIRKNGWVDVYTRVNLNGHYFDIPGSTWKTLEIHLTRKNAPFYSFLMDAGIGEMNALGFGFLNPLFR